jgi:hypothetical protein
MLKKIIQKYKKYKQNKKAYNIGKRAAKGYNIYVTFGSKKTIPKDANDSYRRYSMAMRHYNQELCSKEYFLLGYDEQKVKSNTDR